MQACCVAGACFLGNPFLVIFWCFLGVLEGQEREKEKQRKREKERNIERGRKRERERERERERDREKKKTNIKQALL